jgi:predicted Rossmann fold flavoprotein
LKTFDTIIIGAGAAGLMAAISAGSRGQKVLVVEHAKKVGRKILMSGGGRCNFTNMYTEPANFLSQNPHFFKSALSQYSQWDFIDLVARHDIPYHEKTLGQLFCDNSSKDIVQMLLKECHQYSIDIATQTKVSDINKMASGFTVKLNGQAAQCHSLIIATGGLSIPSMGPHGFGYKLAEQFGLVVLATSAALVPFVMGSRWQKQWVDIAGSSLEVDAAINQQHFTEGMLFTHKGVSGPAILQISSYWQAGEKVSINLAPSDDIGQWLVEQKKLNGKTYLKTLLAKKFSKRFSGLMCQHWFNDSVINEIADQELLDVGQKLNNLELYPETTEGYKTAEVTLGGVNTDHLSSKTMMCKDIDGLFFIGEVVDVTGHLGGFNFQWAWSSGWVAGQNC